MREAVSRKAGTLRRVLFLCPDNYSLGRFCEEYFNSLARTEGLNWQAGSRAALRIGGLRPAGDPIDPAVLTALRRLRAAPVNHRRFPLAATWRDTALSDIVIGLRLRPACADAGDTFRWPHALRIEQWEPAATGEATAIWRFLGTQTVDLVSRLETFTPLAAARAWQDTPATRTAAPETAF